MTISYLLLIFSFCAELGSTMAKRLVVVRSWRAAVLSINKCTRDLFVGHFLKVNLNTKSVIAVSAAPDSSVASDDTFEGRLLSVTARGTLVLR